MVKVEVLNTKEVVASLKKAVDNALDLTLPLTLITQSWYKTNKAIFSLKGPGQYEDLADSTKKSKQRKYKFTYPILKASGRLESALTDPSSSDTLAEIIDKQTAILGVKTGSGFMYPLFLQTGTRFMASRPHTFIDGSQSSPGNLSKRSEIWTKILVDYINKKLEDQNV